jgi:hypothetical protein
MTTPPNRMTSSVDALSRTSDWLYDDLLLPDETVKIRAEAGSSRRPCWHRAQRS